jgi:general secretion pathway protein D
MMGGRRQPSAALPVLLLVALIAGACASSGAYARAEKAARGDDWDTAVAYYTKAVHDAPDKPEYKLALQRALEKAAIVHLDRARIAEAKDQLGEALREYRRAADFSPLNGELLARTQAVEQKLRDRIEAQRPKPRIEELREQARQANPEPTLNPASRTPIDVTFNNASLAAILKFIGQTTGINVTFERDAARPAESQQYTVELHGVTLEQALYQILLANGYYYKVLDPHTIMVIQDTPTKRMTYEDQAIQTFYVSHADANDLFTVLQGIVRLPGGSSPPTLQVNKTANTITARASPSQLKVIEQVIQANDKPRAELILEVEVLEVNRTKAAQYGLDLGDYSINLLFSPEGAPGVTTSSSTGSTGTSSSSPSTLSARSVFNLNSLNGVNKGDFYMSIPAATIRLLETDTDTKLVAKPQLRGSEGEKLTLNLGQQLPVPSTTFGSYGGGGINTIPISSFTLKDVGLNFAITPRVTFENDIILLIELENSAYQGTINIAGQDLPSFGSRKVSTRLRLRDGEPNLLAGLLQSTEQKSVKGFPGLVHLPVFKQLFSSNNNQLTQNDIVMLLTPHIIRSHELTQSDVSPIYIGTSSNMGVTGPPPLIAPPASGGGAADQPAQPARPGQGAPGAAGVTPPVGTPPAGVPAGAVTPPGVPPPPGAAAPPAAQPATPPGPPGAAAAQPTTPPAAPGAPPWAAGAQPGAAAAAPAAAQPAQPATITVTASGPDFRVGGGPYTVPITISGASGVATLSISVRFNPAVLKVRSVQDGTFMRQGGVNPQFGQQVDATGGRVDIMFTRTGDSTGAAGAGLLGAILFDPVAAGSATLTISGVAAGPGGRAVPLQFAPATVTVK